MPGTAWNGNSVGFLYAKNVGILAGIWRLRKRRERDVSYGFPTARGWG